MNILIVGATGNAGSRIVAEAVRRGHRVTAASRRRSGVDAAEGATVLLDGADPERVAHVARGHDVIVGATRPAVGYEGDVVATTHGLAEGARNAGVRLIVIGGAAPLLVPGTERRALDDPEWVPAQVRVIAAASARQLEVLQSVADCDWLYLAPAAVFEPGERTGRYRTALRTLVVDGARASSVSMEDFAIAVLDEVEQPSVHHDVLGVGR